MRSLGCYFRGVMASLTQLVALTDGAELHLTIHVSARPAPLTPLRALGHLNLRPPP